MNTLEKLKSMSDNQIQNWLRFIDAEDLKRAIPVIDEETRKCIYKNMSENAGKTLKVLAKNANKLEKEVLAISIKNLGIALSNF